MKPPPPMPELCGSTTPSASMVAIAASVALPPARSISAPAAAARGSAALTTPRVSTAGVSAGRAGRVAQPPSRSGANGNRRRKIIGTLLFASHRLGNRAEAVAPHQRLEAAHDPAGDARPLEYHRAVELDQARPGADALPGVLGAENAAGSD